MGGQGAPEGPEGMPITSLLLENEYQVTVVMSPRLILKWPLLSLKWGWMQGGHQVGVRFILPGAGH